MSSSCHSDQVKRVEESFRERDPSTALGPAGILGIFEMTGGGEVFSYAWV